MVKRWRVVAGLVIVGTAVLVTGTALADIPDGGVFHACVKDKHDADGELALRIIDTDARSTCRRDETLVSWNQTGPAGQVGPAGAAGAPRTRWSRRPSWSSWCARTGWTDWTRPPGRAASIRRRWQQRLRESQFPGHFRRRVSRCHGGAPEPGTRHLRVAGQAALSQ